MTRRAIGAAIVAAALAAGILGCTEAQPRVVEGSVVRVAVDAPLSSLNAASSAGRAPTTQAVASLVRDQFYVYNAEWELVPDPGFGTATPLPGSGFDVKYQLADTATWSDGVRVSSADLLLAWVAASGSLDSLAGSGFDAAESIPVAVPPVFPTVGDDGFSLTVYYGAEVAGWQSFIDVQVPAHELGKSALGLDDPQEAAAAVVDAILGKDPTALSSLAEGWNGALGAESSLVSSGPYEIVRWSEEKVDLVANSAYRGSRQPRVETIRLLTMEDPLAAVQSLAGGAVDVVTPVPSPEVQEELLAIADVTVLSGSDTAVEHLDLQFVGGRSGVFSEPLVREAFLLALPRQQIVSAIVGDLFEDAAPQSSFIVPSTSTQYDEIIAANGSERFAEPDTERAAALLAEAGVSSPGVCVLFDADDEARMRAFELIADSATSAGFVVTDCSTSDPASVLGRAGAYDAALFSWSAPDASSGWLGSVYASEGDKNLNGYSSEAVDTLLEKLTASTEPQERGDILAQIDAKLWADSYGAPLFQQPALTAFSESVSGVVRAPLPSGVFWNAWEWVPVDAR